MPIIEIAIYNKNQQNIYYQLYTRWLYIEREIVFVAITVQSL